jgi:hypothetical protein
LKVTIWLARPTGPASQMAADVTKRSRSFAAALHVNDDLSPIGPPEMRHSGHVDNKWRHFSDTLTLDIRRILFDF